MDDRGNKTIMCSVLFLDIVEYSKKSVSGQISLKDRFNGYLSEAIRNVPIADRIILDTGDGAAINFIGDVEDALKAALSLRESLLNEPPNPDNPLLVRMGINLGPVRLVRDINGQPNIVGDGINVAQRVMGFADPGQVLVSRSYFDAVSRLSHDYAEMFHYQGSRTDKHVREHEVYAIGYPGELTTKFVPAVEGGQTGSLTGLWQRVRQVWDAAAAPLDRVSASLLDRLAQLGAKRSAIYAAAGILSLLLVVGVGIKLASHDDAGVASDDLGSAVQPASAVMAQVTEQSPVTGTAGQPAASVEKNIQSKPADKKPTDKKPVDKKPASPKSDAQPKAAETSSGTGLFGLEADRSKDGFLSVSCKEGTQVFVDGTQKGKIDAGSLTVGLRPGKHSVIVSHPGGGIHTQSVEIDTGKTVRIRPDFCGR